MSIFKTKAKPESETQLRKAVVEYLNEIANPAPDATMRVILRRKLAELVGVEDPAETLRKWWRSNSPLNARARGGKKGK